MNTSYSHNQYKSGKSRAECIRVNMYYLGITLILSFLCQTKCEITITKWLYFTRENYSII